MRTNRYAADEPLQPRTVNLLWALVMTVILALVSTQCSCTASHPVKRIALPSTAPVQTAVATAAVHNDKAAASNARAVALALKAVRAGITAGSQDATDLVADTRTTDDELAAVKVQLGTAKASIDDLTAQLLKRQVLIDKQTDRLADLEPKYAAAVKTIWWYRIRCWGLVALSALILATVLIAKFTKWGTATLGPYLVDAEHLAAKAAPLVALA